MVKFYNDYAETHGHSFTNVIRDALDQFCEELDIREEVDKNMRIMFPERYE